MLRQLAQEQVNRDAIARSAGVNNRLRFDGASRKPNAAAFNLVGGIKPRRQFGHRWRRQTRNQLRRSKGRRNARGHSKATQHSRCWRQNGHGTSLANRFANQFLLRAKIKLPSQPITTHRFDIARAIRPIDSSAHRRDHAIVPTHLTTHLENIPRPARAANCEVRVFWVGLGCEFGRQRFPLERG